MTQGPRDPFDFNKVKEIAEENDLTGGTVLDLVATEFPDSQDAKAEPIFKEKIIEEKQNKPRTAKKIGRVAIYPNTEPVTEEQEDKRKKAKVDKERQDQTGQKESAKILDFQSAKTKAEEKRKDEERAQKILLEAQRQSDISQRLSSNIFPGAENHLDYFNGGNTNITIPAEYELGESYQDKRDREEIELEEARLSEHYARKELELLRSERIKREQFEREEKLRTTQLGEEARKLALTEHSRKEGEKLAAKRKKQELNLLIAKSRSVREKIKEDKLKQIQKETEQKQDDENNELIDLLKTQGNLKLNSGYGYLEDQQNIKENLKIDPGTLTSEKELYEAYKSDKITLKQVRMRIVELQEVREEKKFKEFRETNKDLSLEKTFDEACNLLGLYGNDKERFQKTLCEYLYKNKKLDARVKEELEKLGLFPKIEKAKEELSRKVKLLENFEVTDDWGEVSKFLQLEIVPRLFRLPNFIYNEKDLEMTFSDYLQPEIIIKLNRIFDANIDRHNLELAVLDMNRELPNIYKKVVQSFSGNKQIVSKKEIEKALEEAFSENSVFSGNQVSAKSKLGDLLIDAESLLELKSKMDWKVEFDKHFFQSKKSLFDYMTDKVFEVVNEQANRRALEIPNVMDVKIFLGDKKFFDLINKSWSSKNWFLFKTQVSNKILELRKEKGITHIRDEDINYDIRIAEERDKFAKVLFSER